MFKAGDVTGKPVIAQDTGKELHKVQSLVVDPSRNQLMAFVVDQGTLLTPPQIIPWQGIQTIGPDAVIIRAETMAVSADRFPAIHAIMKDGHTFTGKKIVTTDGRELGTVADVFFDERTGIVVGYEASGGAMTDVANGRPFIAVRQVVKNGEDVLFVDPTTADVVEGQAGGLKAAVQNVSDKLQDATAATGVEQARGRQILQPVQDSKGLIFAAPGMAVTDATIQRAKDEHKERELLQAVGLDPNTAASSNVKAAAASTRKDVQENVDQLKEGATTFIDRIKEAVSQTQEQAAQEAEKGRINYALGRPVTRVILDKQDHVILNVGELITHEAVNLARHAGVLDVLLNSVYDKTPELSTDDMKASQPGEAALDKDQGNQSPDQAASPA